MEISNINVVNGVVISLAFEYLPVLSTQFDKLTPRKKQIAVLLTLFVTSVLLFGVSCAGVSTGVACSQVGAKELYSLVVNYVFSALTATATHGSINYIKFGDDKPQEGFVTPTTTE